MTGARKHTVAGNIPDEWDAKLIKNCCDVVRGASPRPAGDPRYFDGDYLPWITVADVTGMPGMYLDGTRTKLTKEGANFTRLIPPATLIITNSGATLGVPKITRELSGANDGIAVFLNLKDVSKECLFYILESKTEYFRNELAPGVGQPNLNTELLGDVAIPIPPPGEQETIVGALSTWDTAIQKTEQLIAAKERHYSHELSRLISLGQHPHTHIGAFAEEVSARNRGGKWRTVQLSDIATVWKGQQLNKDAMVEDGAYYALNGGVKPSGRTTEWNCEADTITVSSGGNSCGFIRFNSERFWCGGDCFALKKLSPEVDVSYLFHYLKGQQHRMMALRTGSGIPHVYRSDVEAFPVVLPDLATQTAIARYLNALREEIDLLVQSVAALKTQKRGLMQKLLTGQWRLPIIEGTYE